VLAQMLYPAQLHQMKLLRLRKPQPRLPLAGQRLRPLLAVAVGAERCLVYIPGPIP
jgi:hypothetical protein